MRTHEVLYSMSTSVPCYITAHLFTPKCLSEQTSLYMLYISLFGHFGERNEGNFIFELYYYSVCCCQLGLNNFMWKVKQSYDMAAIVLVSMCEYAFEVNRIAIVC